MSSVRENQIKLGIANAILCSMSDAPIPERRRTWTPKERERIAELERKWKERRPEDIGQELRDERSKVIQRGHEIEE